MEWSFVVWDLDQWLRHKIKYNDHDELQIVRDKLWEIMKDRDVSLDDIY